MRILQEMQELRQFSLHGEVPDTETLFRILPNLKLVKAKVATPGDSELIVCHEISYKMIRCAFYDNSNLIVKLHIKFQTKYT